MNARIVLYQTGCLCLLIIFLNIVYQIRDTRIELLSCKFLLQRIGQNYQIPLLLSDVDTLRKVESSENCFINAEATILIRTPAVPSTTVLARLRDELIENGMFPFLNSGTLLGWYRECSIIPHTNDLDFAIFAESYKPEFLAKVKKNQSEFDLSRQLGMLNDSFELTLIPKSGLSVYIDLFLMYKEPNNEYRWTGGMSNDGQKYKFSHPPYDPWCSADLHGHLFWVTCTPRQKIEAEHGKLWYRDQHSSTYVWSSTGKKNGRWTWEQMKEVFNVYKYENA